MFVKGELEFNDLSGRRLTYSVSGSFVPGYDLSIGQSDTLKFLKTVPDKSVKLIVTSPPYNIGKVYEERVKLEEYLKYQSEVAIYVYNGFLQDTSKFKRTIPRGSKN